MYGTSTFDWDHGVFNIRVMGFVRELSALSNLALAWPCR